MSVTCPRPRRSQICLICSASILAGAASAAYAQEGPSSGAPTPSQASSDQAAAGSPAQGAPQAEPRRKTFVDLFIDDDDGYFDFSDFLGKGGFIPLPIIITEPAVGNGGGVAAAFLSRSPERPRQMTRTVVAGFRTGNGSEGVGFFRAGYALDGRLNYRIGGARGKITLESFPAAAPGGVEYTSHYDYGLVGSALWSLSEHVSVGPLFDFRKLRSVIDVKSLPPEFADQFDGRTLKTGAVGLGLHFDSRDNPLTPSRGVNAYVEGRFNRAAFGSDRDYEDYDTAIFAFGGLTPKLNYALKLEFDAIRGDFPVYFAPAINLRGVQAVRYQGTNVASSEAEVTWRVRPRWALLAFAGAGAADASGSRLLKDSGAIFTGGVGFRYRLARKLGLDAGADVAYGPSGAVFYIQFGHAWSLWMD